MDFLIKENEVNIDIEKPMPVTRKMVGTPKDFVDAVEIKKLKL